MNQVTKVTVDTLLTGVTAQAINPALSLLPPAMDSREARVMLLAIGLQESGFIARRQYGGGPARGLWQFEPGTRASRGGVWGVWLHKASRYWVHLLCEARKCDFEPAAIYARVETDDILAAGLARLLLFTDAYALPALGEVDRAWRLYRERTWRPGKPHADKWPENYRQALAFVTEGAQ